MRVSCEELGREPRVWLRVPGYVVRNFSADLEQSVLHHMTSVFLVEEPIFSSSGFKGDALSIGEVREFCRTFLKQNITLVAQAEGAPGADLKPVSGVVPLAGVNILRLTRRDDPPTPPIDALFNGAATRKALNAFRKISSGINIFELYDVNQIVEAAGLAVHPEHRGRGLGVALLQARFSLCSALGVRVTKTVFTSVPAQKVARKCGFSSLREVRYGDLKDEQGRLEFPNLPPDNTANVTVRTIDLE